MIYHFDVVGIAFLCQDMSKFNVCAQIYMSFAFYAMPVLRSISLSGLCLVHVSRSTCWLLCHVLLKPFYLLMYFFLVFWPLWQGVDLDLMVQVYIHTPRPISKGLDHFLYACPCLLACFYALCLCFPLQIQALPYFVRPVGLLVWLRPSLLGIDWVQLLMRYTSVVLVCLVHTFLCSVRCLYACLACFVPSVQLSLLPCIFACLPTCSCMSLCVVHTSIQWSYGYSIQPYICPPRRPSFCLIICLFTLLYALLALVWLSLLVCSLHNFPISFASFFACFFHLCMYTYGVWTLGARV